MNIWQPLERAEVKPKPEELSTFGEHIRDIMYLSDIWINDTYQVVRTRLPAPTEDVSALIHLSIKRRDREAIHDWRDFQLIKNQLVGPECEGLEIYPAESRLCDSANQYHIFVFESPSEKIGIGFDERLVSEDMVAGSKQRPFYDNMKPADLVDLREYAERVRKG